MNVRRIPLKNDAIAHTVDVSYDGRYLAIGQGYTEGKANVTVWALEDLSFATDVATVEHELVQSVRFGRRGAWLAYVATNGRPTVVDLKDHEARELPDPGHAFWLAASLEADRLAISGDATHAYDVKKNRVLWKLDRPNTRSHTDDRPIAALAPDGNDVAVLGARRDTVEILRVGRRGKVRTYAGAPPTARCLGYSRSGRRIGAVETYGNAAYVWDLESGVKLHEDVFDPGYESTWSLALDPRDRYAALGTLGGHIQLVRLDDGEFAEDEDAHDGQVWDLAFTPDGRRLISAAEDGVRVWDVPS